MFYSVVEAGQRQAPGAHCKTCATFLDADFYLSGKVKLGRSESSEDARLAACGPHVVTLYTRPGCHLCEEAKTAIMPLLGQYGATLRQVNIDEDAALKERYAWDIPVIFVGTRKVAKHHVDIEQLRRQLSDAR